MYTVILDVDAIECCSKKMRLVSTEQHLNNGKGEDAFIHSWQCRKCGKGRITKSKMAKKEK